MIAGATSIALGSAQEALRSVRRETISDPISRSFAIASAYRLIGESYRKAGDEALARQAWEEGYSQLPRSASERPREILERATLLRYLSHSVEARELIDTLHANGFNRRDN